jgi:hypothetical protein
MSMFAKVANEVIDPEVSRSSGRNLWSQQNGFLSSGFAEGAGEQVRQAATMLLHDSAR